jgi:hypothetical protein
MHNSLQFFPNYKEMPYIKSIGLPYPPALQDTISTQWGFLLESESIPMEAFRAELLCQLGPEIEVVHDKTFSCPFATRLSKV